MRNRRKKQFIDSAVQGALIRRITLHWLIFFAMALFTLPLWQLMRSEEFFVHFSRLMLQGLADTAPVFIILLAMLPLFVWDTVTFSNRFAGPMYRFHKAIRALAAGEDSPPIRLRKRDLWKDVADDFNAMLQRLASERERNAASAGRDAVACGSLGDEEGL